MFERFAERFTVTAERDGREPWREERLLGAQGYLEFAEQYAGCTFDQGLYRFHDAVTGPRGQTWIDEAFPDYRGRATPFGYDWLGRQVALDGKRIEQGEPHVLLFEPGSGDVFQVPVAFAAFHDQELLDNTDAALLDGMFGEWSRSDGAALPLRDDQCVGYRIPLFLGGQDEVANLEVTDLDVYWSLSGQMGSQVGDAPEGTPVEGATIED